MATLRLSTASRHIVPVTPVENRRAPAAISCRSVRCHSLSSSAVTSSSSTPSSANRLASLVSRKSTVSASQSNRLRQWRCDGRRDDEASNGSITSDIEGVSRPASATRSGLFRSPVAGGVESATNAHGLPAPAVAVRNLIEQAQYAHLCTIMSRTHHRRKGYPFGSLVDFTTDLDGHPIFLLSPLGIHSRNLVCDPRCTVVVQIPGWSGLANARATIFGDVYPLPKSQQEWARGFYVQRHQHGAAQQWGNFNFYRMDTICDIYFVGGFGTVAWIDVKEYVAATPDRIATDNVEQTLQELNDRLGRDLKSVLAASSPHPVDDASFISIDSKGADVRVRHAGQSHVERLSFGSAEAVESADAAVTALRRMLTTTTATGVTVVPLAKGFNK